MTIQDDTEYCLTRPGMNPHAEPCRFEAGHRGRHSWDLTLRAEEAAIRARAGKATLSKAEIIEAIGRAAGAKIGWPAPNQVIAAFKYAPDGELTHVDVELLPRDPVTGKVVRSTTENSGSDT